MKIRESGNSLKPKNFSRKVFICSCQCVISCGSNALEYVTVKYEVDPNKELHYYAERKKSFWSTPHIWGKIKRIIELPSMFSKLDEEDFIVYTGYFRRDNVDMPFVSNIEIFNIEKYKKIKLQEQRKEKLSKLITF